MDSDYLYNLIQIILLLYFLSFVLVLQVRCILAISSKPMLVDTGKVAPVMANPSRMGTHLIILWVKAPISFKDSKVSILDPLAFLRKCPTEFWLACS